MATVPLAPGRRPIGRLALVASLPVLSVAFALASCVGLSTAPSGIASIQFDSALQGYPSVVAGDSFRDSTGAVVPLLAVAFDGAGKKVTTASISFLTIDTTATVTPTGSAVVAGNYPGLSARLFALTAGLESAALTLPIVPRPDTLALTVFNGNLTAAGAAVLADTFTVVVDNDTSGVLQPVPHWLVSYRLEYHGQTVPLTDTTIAYFTSPEDLSRVGIFHPSLLDTTATDGTASRVLLIKPAGLAKPLDSLVVYATARYRGKVIAGSPLRRVVLIQ